MNDDFDSFENERSADLEWSTSVENSSGAAGILSVAGPTSGDKLHADFNGDGISDLVVGVGSEVINGAQGGSIHVIYGSKDGPTTAGDQFWHQDCPGVLGSVDPSDHFGESLAAGDFNGDGYADLAIGAYNDTVDGIDGAGVVNVLYGSANGLSAGGNQLWHQDSAGVKDEAEVGDHFGRSLTSGDFDGDGHDDLAIGVPLEDPNGEINAGMINVLYGSSSGLSAAGDQIWHQGIAGVEGSPDAFDFFGESLAAGDFNGDGVDDLAIGVRGEDLDFLIDAGLVHVLHGSSVGLTASAAQTWTQDTTHVPGIAESFDHFGHVLSVGDFDKDGHADLAVGVPHEDVGPLTDAGAVNVFYGSAHGLLAKGSQFWHQDSSGVDGAAEPYDRFGSSLAAGDFNRDACDDLAIGVPLEDLPDLEDAGAVNVLNGSILGGLSSKDDERWHQDSSGIKGVAETSDAFGSTLTAGDYNGDGAADLVIGVPFEDLGSLVDAGAINLIYGGESGLSGSKDESWSQKMEGLTGVAEAGDTFGSSLH